MCVFCQKIFNEGKQCFDKSVQLAMVGLEQAACVCHIRTLRLSHGHRFRD
jgi:hypothetical protein